MADEQDASIADGTTEIQLEQGSNEIPPITYREIGSSGLLVLDGQIIEESQKELRWPQAIHTYKKMEADAAISPALDLVETMIARVPWDVRIPEGYEDELKEKAVYLKQVMHDMEQDWQTMIKQAATFKRYGFSALEIVLRYRRKEKGSRFNDGLVGVKKLGIRSPDTIEGWYWKNNGRELAGMTQRVIPIDDKTKGNGWDFVNATTSTVGVKFKKIPRKKFLLFRNNPVKDSPIGRSALNGCHTAWKFKTAFMESEALSCAQDVNGFKVLYLPPKYMTPDASEEDKLVFTEYQKAMANMHQAKQSGLILPLLLDENGKRMFDFEVMNITGQKAHDVNEIITRYNAEILTCLFADILALGQSGGGSFALGETKISIIEMGVEAALDEIKSQLNHHLVPLLFEQNGWDTEVLPEFVYGKVGRESLDEISKFVQRVKATGMLPRNRETVNWLLKQADIPYRVPDNMTDEDFEQMMGASTSKSGASLNTPTGGLNGTANTVDDEDNSVANNENT